MKIIRLIPCILIIILMQNISYSQEKELRGVWVAWAGSSVPSKERIASIMDDLAAHNMNTVYVDIWRFGYPYFRSNVFQQLTGIWTDPAIDEGRDLLAEFIAEGHRNGLHVEAWFEYGFVACQGNIEHLYKAHPQWFAKKKNGSVLFNGDYRYKWLSHCNSEAQQFLIDLCLEVIQNYDVDGIELDRIRYPELDCGYDSATIALYKKDHNGNVPPQTIANANWMRWRADKLTEFTAVLYDTIKKVRPEIFVSNAPIVYSYGFDNFCQDWRPWINEGYLDFISPQVYRSTNAQYSSDLNIQFSYVRDKSKFYPGLTTITDTYLLPTSEIIAMIETTRKRGLTGHVIWFYDTLADDLPALKAKLYQTPVHIPNRPEDWREPAIIINEDDSSVHQSNGWIDYTSIAGFEDGCIYSKSSTDEWIEYSAAIEKSGWYEVYCYNIYHWNAAPEAQFQIYHQNGIDTVAVDQSEKGHARWYKIGDYQLTSGKNQKIIRLTNANIGNHILFADAIMLLNTNRPVKNSSGIDSKKKPQFPTDFELNQNFPNPFNPSTSIQFALTAADHILLKIYDIEGKEIATLIDEYKGMGQYTIDFSAQNLTSGLYFYKMQVGNKSQTKKMLYVK